MLCGSGLPLAAQPGLTPGGHHQAETDTIAFRGSRFLSEILRITPEGKGKVDPRIDNMGYWSLMARKGYVGVSPKVEVPEARTVKEVSRFGFMVQGSKFKVQGSRFKVQSLRFKVQGSGFKVQSSRLQVQGSEFPVSGFGFRVQDSPDIAVSTDQEVTQSENSVFIDPDDESVALNSNNSSDWILGLAEQLYGADALNTNNGGTSWQGSVQGVNGTNGGDPAVAIGRNGWWYVGKIDGSFGQSVSYSKDRGKSWKKVQVSSGPSSGNGVLDKNHLWIDNTEGSPYEGYLYDAWTDLIPGSPGFNQVHVSRSADGGLTWSSPWAVSAAALAGNMNHGVNLHTGPDGALYAVWSIYDTWPSDETAIGFAKSLDGGGIFTPAVRIINNIKGIRASMTGKSMRVNAFPSMAVDNSTGPNRGTIYVVFANVGYPGVNSGSDIDVYLIRSADGGASWSAPVRVNQDPAGLGKQHFFPWITCDPVTGGLCVIYYDDRDAGPAEAAAWISYSYDGGLTWSDMQVSDVIFTPSPVPGLAYDYFGDYLGIQSRNMKVYPMWTDNRDGRAMTYVSPFDPGPNPNQPWVVYYASSVTPITTDDHGDTTKTAGVRGGEALGESKTESGSSISAAPAGSHGWVHNLAATAEIVGNRGFEAGNDRNTESGSSINAAPAGSHGIDHGMANTAEKAVVRGAEAGRDGAGKQATTLSTLPFGDSVHLSVSLKNIGDQKSGDVTALLWSDSPYVSITDSTAFYGPIDSSVIVTVPDAYALKVSDSIPDNLAVRFNLLASDGDSSWFSHFAVEASAPHPLIRGMATGGSGRFNPGDTVDLVFLNQNTGDFPCVNTTGYLVINPPYITMPRTNNAKERGEKNLAAKVNGRSAGKLPGLEGAGRSSGQTDMFSDSVQIGTLVPCQMRETVFRVVIDPEAPVGSGVDFDYTLKSGFYHDHFVFRKIIGMVAEDWESNTFSKFPWMQSGSRPWTITDLNPWEGRYCAQSGAIGDYQSSQMFMSYASATDDSISFYLRTSSEPGYDFLYFQIDNVTEGQWSGETPWTRVSFPVTAGIHQYRWIYHKDLAFAYGLDRAWVDYIVMPAPVLPVVDPGSDTTLCAGAVVRLNASATLCDSVRWTTTGDGVFDRDTSLQTIYTPGTADIVAGAVRLSLTAYATYGSTTKHMEITIRPLPVAHITALPQEDVCAGTAITLTADTAAVTDFRWIPGNMTTPAIVIDTSKTGGLGTFQYRLLTTNQYLCSNRDSVQVRFRDCTGIAEQEIQWSVWPNPAGSWVIVDAWLPSPAPVVIRISNGIGQTIFSEEISPGGAHLVKQIVTGRIPGGIYHLTLKTQLREFTRKVVFTGGK